MEGEGRGEGGGGEDTIVAYAWHDPSVFDPSTWGGGCYARVDVHSAPLPAGAWPQQAGVTSGRVGGAGPRQAALDVSDHVVTKHLGGTLYIHPISIHILYHMYT